MLIKDVAPGCPVITQPFGCTSFAGEWAVSGAVCSSGWFHRGVDLAGANCCDTPLLAVGDGVVQAVGQTFTGAGGLGPGAILLRMEDGVLAVYGHGYAECSPGQRVGKGQRIGRVGSQGFSTGCHLHLEICTQLGTVPGGCINPLSYEGPGIGPGGFLMALTDEQQIMVFDRVNALWDSLASPEFVRTYGAGNDAGRCAAGSLAWLNAQGQEVRDMMGVVLQRLDAIEAKVRDG